MMRSMITDIYKREPHGHDQMAFADDSFIVAARRSFGCAYRAMLPRRCRVAQSGLMAIIIPVRRIVKEL